MPKFNPIGQVQFCPRATAYTCRQWRVDRIFSDGANQAVWGTSVPSGVLGANSWWGMTETTSQRKALIYVHQARLINIFC